MILELRQFLINADMHIIIKTIIQVIPKFSNLPCLHSISSIHFESNPFFYQWYACAAHNVSSPFGESESLGVQKLMIEILRENSLIIFLHNIAYLTHLPPVPSAMFSTQRVRDSQFFSVGYNSPRSQQYLAVLKFKSVVKNCQGTYTRCNIFSIFL